MILRNLIFSKLQTQFHLHSSSYEKSSQSCHISFNKTHLVNPLRSLRTTRILPPTATAPATKSEGFYTAEEEEETLYEVLGVSEDAELSDIKRAYKQLALKCHPDKALADRTYEYNAEFVRINKAYETLSDPESRAVYDRSRIALGEALSDLEMIEEFVTILKTTLSNLQKSMSEAKTAEKQPVQRAYLVGVARKDDTEKFSIEESLNELELLAASAGLWVVDSTYQNLSTPNPRTYIGSGKVAEVQATIDCYGAGTVILDDELSPGQLRNLEKAFGGKVRVFDRTDLILDIFSQRATTREAALQVELAQMEYQLPRLTKTWTHLGRQSGGKVKGMGEKQFEVERRILRTTISLLRKDLESIRKHRKECRTRRLSAHVPVVSLVGYTNSGKSTLMNQLTRASVLAEDRLFATLDPNTRRVKMKNAMEFLVTDTVGFIQKLPTTLFAAFQATLEEISESSLIVHVIDISHPLAEEHIEVVEKVLSELDASSIPKLMAWNKNYCVNLATVLYPEEIKLIAKDLKDTICISALNSDGLDELCDAVKEQLKEYTENGTHVRAHVPLRYASLLTPMRKTRTSRSPISSEDEFSFL